MMAVNKSTGGIVWLKFWRRSRDPKKRSGDEAFEIFLAALPLVAAPPPTLTRQVQRPNPPPNLYTIPPATQATQKLEEVMNTIMSTEIMNTFPKTFVQDFSYFYNHYFASSHVCFFIFL